MERRNGGQPSLNLSTVVRNEHSFNQCLSMKEMEHQRELNNMRQELEREKQKMQSKEMELHQAISCVEQEVCEYKKQLELVEKCLEMENKEWEAAKMRLEAQIERERLKVRSRDAEILRITLAREQEVTELKEEIESIRTSLGAENASLREQLLQASRNST